jgi:hypothetical protein
MRLPKTNAIRSEHGRTVIVIVMHRDDRTIVAHMKRKMTATTRQLAFAEQQATENLAAAVTIERKTAHSKHQRTRLTATVTSNSDKKVGNSLRVKFTSQKIQTFPATCSRYGF